MKPSIMALIGLAALGVSPPLKAADWSTFTSHEDVDLAGASFHVSWKRTGDGVDAYATTNEKFTLFLDMLKEKRQAIDAMKTIASRECNGSASIMAEINEGRIFEAQFQCKPDQPSSMSKRKSVH